mmetsp:Transcript_2959/g.5704  ORF Transcript_2959/g.5704 Transcript_2959/m.5704 type:complete len:117 (+) Transcript_2959:6671-7021(+)
MHNFLKNECNDQSGYKTLFNLSTKNGHTTNHLRDQKVKISITIAFLTTTSKTVTPIDAPSIHPVSKFLSIPNPKIRDTTADANSMSIVGSSSAAHNSIHNDGAGGRGRALDPYFSR